MEHAKRMAHKLFNYQFKNELNQVKTANVIDYYTRISNKPSSTPINNLDIWSPMVNCWYMKYVKLKMKSIIDRTEFFNKNRILSYYRDSFDYMVQNINITVQYRIPSDDNETNFETIKFLVNDYNQFLRMIKEDRMFKLDEHKVKTKEVNLPPEQHFEQFYPVEQRIVPKKFTRPIQYFERILTYSKGQRGLHYTLQYY